MTLFLLNQRLIITKIVQRLSAMQAIELRDFRVCCPLSVIGGTIALLIRVLWQQKAFLRRLSFLKDFLFKGNHCEKLSVWKSRPTTYSERRFLHQSYQDALCECIIIGKGLDVPILGWIWNGWMRYEEERGEAAKWTAFSAIFHFS